MVWVETNMVYYVVVHMIDSMIDTGRKLLCLQKERGWLHFLAEHCGVSGGTYGYQESKAHRPEIAGEDFARVGVPA